MTRLAAAALLCLALALWAGAGCGWGGAWLGGYARVSVACGRGGADVYVAWRRR